MQWYHASLGLERPQPKLWGRQEDLLVTMFWALLLTRRWNGRQRKGIRVFCPLTHMQGIVFFIFTPILKRVWWKMETLKPGHRQRPRFLGGQAPTILMFHQRQFTTWQRLWQDMVVLCECLWWVKGCKGIKSWMAWMSGICKINSEVVVNLVSMPKVQFVAMKGCHSGHAVTSTTCPEAVNDLPDWRGTCVPVEIMTIERSITFNSHAILWALAHTTPTHKQSLSNYDPIPLLPSSRIAMLQPSSLLPGSWVILMVRGNKVQRTWISRLLCGVWNLQ